MKRRLFFKSISAAVVANKALMAAPENKTPQFPDITNHSGKPSIFLNGKELGAAFVEHMRLSGTAIPSE